MATIYGKNLLKSSREPNGWWPWNLVCSIGYSSTTKFVQMMTLGWPWSIYSKVWFSPFWFCMGKCLLVLWSVSSIKGMPCSISFSVYSVEGMHSAVAFSAYSKKGMPYAIAFSVYKSPPGFNCWFSFAPVFQWCCSTPQGSPGVGRIMFLSSPHLCFIIVFICDLFVSRDDPLMS